MQCFDCKKLRLECERTALDHRELLRLREAEARTSQQSGPEIWDFIMDMAIKKQADAERAWADHRAMHAAILTRPASIITAVLGPILDAAGLCEALGGAFAF